MVKVTEVIHSEGELFVTAVHYPGTRNLRDVDTLRRASDGAIWKVRVTDGPVAYLEGGIVVGALLGLSLEGDAVVMLGDELVPA